MARKRSSKGLLIEPSKVKNISDSDRQKFLDKANSDFVTKTPANKKYYMTILELLFPFGHGIPGPIVSQSEIRDALDVARASEGKDTYKDPFRRLRELQGEEGFTCIIKEGTKYQLKDLSVRSKREPRIQISKQDWNAFKATNGFRCSHCGMSEPDVKLSPDHRQPRARGGTNDMTNIQPLCEQCNILKSSACMGCSDNCFVCPWAFPETYKPIKINDDNKELIRRLAEKKNKDQSGLVNDILKNYFNNNK